MKNRDGALAVPVMRTYYKIYKIIAIRHVAVTDRLMEQNRGFEQTSLSTETIDETKDTTIQWRKTWMLLEILLKNLPH